MADTAQFIIDIQAKTSSLASASSALSKLQTQLQQETKTLQILEAQMKRLQGGQSVNIADHQKLAGLIDAQKSKLAGLTNQYVEMAGGAQQGGQATGFLAEKIQGLGGASGIAIGIIVALATAIAVATEKLFSFALAAADARRSLLLSFEGLLGNVGAAHDLADAIDNLRHHTAVSSEDLDRFGRALAFAGLKGKGLQDAIALLAKVQASAGDEMANKYLRRIREAAAKGEDLGKIMDEIRKKGLVDVGEKQALGFDQQLKDLKQDLADLFKDVDIEPFLKGLQEVLMLFSEQTASGRALHEMITQLFTGAFNILSGVFPYIKAFMQGLIIGFLKVYIALKPIGQAIAQAFGGKPNATLLDFFTMLGKALVYVATVVTVLIGVFATIMSLFVAVTTGIAGVVGVIVGFASGFFQAGYNFVAGLAQGILSGASSVIQAALNVAHGAINAVKNALGIQSPSKVMAEMGMHTAAGFAGGVDAGAGGAQGSMASMVAPPTATSGTTNNKSSSQVFNVTVNVQGSGNAGQDFDKAARIFLDRVAAQLGAA